MCLSFHGKFFKRGTPLSLKTQFITVGEERREYIKYILLKIYGYDHKQRQCGLGKMKISFSLNFTESIVHLRELIHLIVIQL